MVRSALFHAYRGGMQMLLSFGARRGPVYGRVRVGTYSALFPSVSPPHVGSDEPTDPMRWLLASRVVWRACRRDRTDVSSLSQLPSRRSVRLLAGGAMQP